MSPTSGDMLPLFGNRNMVGAKQIGLLRVPLTMPSFFSIRATSGGQVNFEFPDGWSHLEPLRGIPGNSWGTFVPENKFWPMTILLSGFRCHKQFWASVRAAKLGGQRSTTWIEGGRSFCHPSAFNMQSGERQFSSTCAV